MHSYYNLFGLKVSSERAFPELLEIDATETVDVHIKFTPVKALEKKDAEGDILYIIDENVFYLKLLDYARIYAVHEKFTTISIDIIDPDQYSIIKSWLFGSVFTAVLQMNNRFALHASAIKTEEGVVLFCGRSGVGKSTIATRLKKEGFEIISDDKAVLTISDDQNIYIEPSIQITRLWDDSIEKLGENSFLENPESVTNKNDKFQFLIKEEHRIAEALLVKEIYIIREIQENMELQVNRLCGKVKHHRLRQQIHRRQYVEKLNKQKELWQYLHEITSRVSTTILLRPLQTSHEDFTAFVLNEINPS